VWENLEEGDVEEGATSDTLEDSVTNILGKAGGQVRHGYTDTNTNRTGNTEHYVGNDEALGREVRLGNVETQTEGHDGLVYDDSDEDGYELGRVVLKTDSQALKHGVEGERASSSMMDLREECSNISWGMCEWLWCPSCAW